MTQIQNLNSEINSCVNALTKDQSSVFNNWVGSTTGDTLGAGGDAFVSLLEMYQVNNLKQQVANCVLNDFVPDPTLYQVFSPLDAVPEGNLGFIRNTVTGLYYRLTVPASVTRITPFLADPNSPVTPDVTNPLLQPAVTARGVSVSGWPHTHSGQTLWI